jgi:hypothetical protein
MLVCAATGARASGPTAAELAHSIHDASLDPEECYRVRDLSFRKDDIRLYFTDGYLIFSKPAAGQRLSAVFTTDVEGGDGEVILLPPTRGERQSLASFTHSPNLDEHITAALMVFTDGTGAQLHDLVEKKAATKVREVGALMTDQWSPVLANIREGFELRIVDDLVSADPKKSGFMFLGLAGRERGNFDLLYDPRAREQIVAGQLAEHASRLRYNIWTSFMSRSVRTGSAKRVEPGFSLSHFSIDAALDANLHMKASTTIKLRVGRAALRSFPFEIAGRMKVTSVRVDGAPAEVLNRDSVRDRTLRGSEDDALLVVTPEALPAGTEHEFAFEHEGDVIASAGNGVYFVGARSTWYPRSSPEFSTYDLTFRYPRKLTLVTAGDLIDDRIDGDTRITRRSTGVPIRFAGFNLGNYERITGSVPGFAVEVYGNKGLEVALQPKAGSQSEAPSRSILPQLRRDTLQGQSQIPAAPPDPLARLHAVSNDVSSSLEFYSGLFGPPAMKTLTVAPIPGTFGQGFPGLVYLSTIAYLDPSSRPASLRTENQQLFFSDLIVAHEVAHQWWGNVVIISSYQDEWLTEALANYSALLWLEKKSGAKAVDTVLDEFRNRLLTKGEAGNTLESSGPIVWGIRLESSDIPDAWRAITYEKGAWIMHMLRRRLGDDRFLKMLAELRRRYEFRAVTTEEFRALAAQFLPPRSPSDTMDAFFDNWVYSTGIPKFKLQSSIKGLRVSGSVTQTGVDNDFSAEVPIEIQFAKGAPQIVWVRSSSESVPFSVAVKQAPVKVSLSPYSVLSSKK